VAPDGRFIMIQSAGMEEQRLQVVLVQHWFEELKQRVSTK
jgi:hypothetical protein